MGACTAQKEKEREEGIYIWEAVVRGGVCTEIKGNRT